MNVLRRCLAALLLCLPLVAQALVDIPPLQQRVTDLTQTLSPADRQQLELRLQALEQRTTVQIAILLVPTTQPEDIFSYGMRVSESWKLGQKGKDNGALILLAIKDRKSQILTGYGLEGDLPDATNRRLLDEVGSPYFKRADFAGGLNAVLGRMMVAIEGPGMEASQPTGSTKQHARQPVKLDPQQAKMALLVIGLFALGQLLRFATGPVVAASVAGGVLAPSIALVAGSLATGLIWGAGLFLLVLAFRFSWLLLFLQSSGGYSGGGGGGWGSGGGGFSGGGGGFGGGGSSGSW